MKLRRDGSQAECTTLSKMRILHVVPTYLPAVRYGGPIFAVHGLCSALAARGHHVEVFTTSVDGPNDSAVSLGTPVVVDGVHVRYFKSSTLRRLFWSPEMGRALQRDIAGFAIVHLHSVFLWPTWAAARSARAAHVPYVMSPRGMLVKDLIKKRSKIAKSAWIRLIEKRNLERAAAIHVTSEVEAEELRRFPWRLSRVEIIPNGVDQLTVSRSAKPALDVEVIAGKQPMVLFLGRISWKKGLDRLLIALARTQLPRLAIVGPDDEGIVPHLKQLACDLDVKDRVHFLPRTVLGVDKEYLYRAAQLFVLPSHSENFGNTVLEAMQHGLPVIVTPEVGAARIVQDAKGGLVVHADAVPLSEAIQQLTEDHSLARSMGEAGRRHVAEHFGWARVSATMEALYASLVHGDHITCSAEMNPSSGPLLLLRTR